MKQAKVSVDDDDVEPQVCVIEVSWCLTVLCVLCFMSLSVCVCAVRRDGRRHREHAVHRGLQAVPVQSEEGELLQHPRQSDPTGTRAPPSGRSLLAALLHRPDRKVIREGLFIKQDLIKPPAEPQAGLFGPERNCC